MMIDYNLDIESKNNYDINNRIVSTSIIQDIEQSLQNQKNNCNENITRRI